MKKRVPRWFSENLIVFGEKEGYDELEDPPVPEKPKWCGEHKPESDACPVHNLRWQEMCTNALTHTLTGAYNISALFYCSVFFCDEFAWCAGKHRIDYPWRCFLEYNHLPSDFVDITRVAFENTVRLKILFHKLAGREGDGK
ncbi:hypothetical protein A2926_02300 [Candidatus Giovannonibacteria bacterium RIFCSPLOWO2_01_FULL_44_40]|nr:MAG: hypothetical protein A2926_02300 [Candidatus Giovannonibacteria bacterium RIFCSPLOWO2_01_FULL_44_40]